jgi:hypothetical protein
MAERVRNGFAANEPLPRTGQLRDSIEWTAQGNEGFVGSNLDIAVYQELGTSRIPPPRSWPARSLRSGQKSKKWPPVRSSL